MKSAVENDPLFLDLERLLRDSRLPGKGLRPTLDFILHHFGCGVGTIHRFRPATNDLQLVVHRHIPDMILDRVRLIPFGKGMAGLAAQRREPVEVCNLQTDESGTAKPAARLTGMEGSISVPMLVDGELRGVLGIAKPTPHVFSQTERHLLMKIAAMIGREIVTA
jgi:GAF domain-containing protein